MKAFYTAIGLFLAVSIYITVNFFVLNGFFEETKSILESFPTEEQRLEAMSENERLNFSKKLSYIQNKWEDYETYICLSLEHSTSRVFLGYFLPAMSYFEVGEYKDFLAQVKNAKDTVEHLVFDESIRLGTVM